MITKKEIEKLEIYYIDFCNKYDLDYKKVLDINYEIYDKTLTYQENFNILKEKLIPLRFKDDVTKDEVNNMEAENKAIEQKQIENLKNSEIQDDWKLWEEVLPNIRSIVVTGTGGSGKTAECFKILDTAKKTLKDREIYVFKHPKQKLVEQRGFKNLYSLEQISKLEKCVIWLDEPQLIWKTYDSKTNEILAKILSIARHRDILLILSTNMTQFVTRMLEGQVDCWVVKDCDYDSIKQGSRVKKIIQDNSIIDPSYFKLELDEYLFYCRKYEKYVGKHKFIQPSYFNDEHSKPYALKNPERNPETK